MDDAKKNKIEENIDRMAREWYLSKLSNENEGKTLKLRNAIWEETAKLYFSQMNRLDGEINHFAENKLLEEIKWAAFLKAIEAAFENFKLNPEGKESSFIRYFTATYAKKMITEKGKILKNFARNESLEKRIEADSGETYSLNWKDDKNKAAEDGMIEADLMHDFVGLGLNFSENHKNGKQNNKQRRLWYHLFYTEDITRFTKSAEFEEISSHLHERDIFRALRHSYLNFYMSAVCKSLNEIAWTKLKNYEEILPDATENEIGKEISSEKMPAKVSLQYLKVCEHITVGNSTRSNQKKFYDEDKKRLL